MAVMLSDLLRNLTFNRSAHCTQVSDQCPLGLLFFGMLVSLAYGSGNDVLWEEVMSTSKALRLLCIEGDWSFKFKVLLLLLSLCLTKLNLRYRPNNATASETLTDNMTLSKESVFDLPIDALTEKSLYLAGNSQPVPTLPLHIEV